MNLHRRNLPEGSSIWEYIDWRNGYPCNAKVKLSPLDGFLHDIHERNHELWQTDAK